MKSVATGVFAIALATPALAGGMGDEPDTTVVVAPPAGPTEIALFEMNASATDLSWDSDNDGDFDDSPVFGFDGQARLRYDNIMVEIQGALNENTDAGSTPDEVATSFGIFGHYIMSMSGGELGFAGGVTGAQSQDDDEGTAMVLVSAAYAGNGWMLGLGHAQQIAGDSDSDQPVDLSYIQGGYEVGFGAATSLGLTGYYGQVNEGDGDSNNFHEIRLALGYDFSERMRASAAVGHFGLEGSAGGAGNTANGAFLSLGLSIAIGGTPSEARDAIPFDTPYLHRVLAWTDELD